MSTKYLIPIFIVLMAASAFLISRGEAKKGENKIIQAEKIKIATCPTYYDVLNFLDKENYEVIKTDSSSANFYLLRELKVNYVLSGRPLKPGEGNFQTEYIANNGYSFISSEERVINKESLSSEIICTDLDIEIIKADLDVKDVEKIEDINNCPSGSVVVTSWDNTDYSKMNIIHILNNDGTRYKLSRTPILYCNDNCEQNIINHIKNAYEK